MTRLVEHRSTEGRPDRVTSLARGGVANMAGAAVAAVANVLLVVAITRNVPAAVAGTFFAASSIFLIAAVVAKLGTSTGLVFFLSRARALDRPADVRPMLVVALTPVVLVAVLGAVVLYAFAPTIAAVAVDSHRAEFTGLLRALAPFLPAAALTDTWLAATRGFGSMRPTVRIEKVIRALLQVVAVALVAGFLTGPSLSVAWAAPYVVAAALAGWSVRSTTHRLVDRPTAAELPSVRRESMAGHARRFWTFTWPRTFSSIAQFALQRLDVIMVAALRGPVEAAVYTAATRFLVVGQLGAQSISSAAQPQLGEALARDDRRQANEIYRTATAWLMLITWPLYLLSALFAPLILAIFGPGYTDGTVVVVVLAVTMLVATGCGMVDMLLTMGGRTSWNLGNTLLALGVNVGLNLVLIPEWGILGAAAAWAAAILVNNLLPLAQVGFVLRLHPFAAGTARAAVLALACFGLLPAVVLATGVPTFVALVVSSAIGLPLYAAACWTSRDVLRLTSLKNLRRGAEEKP